MDHYIFDVYLTILYITFSILTSIGKSGAADYENTHLKEYIAVQVIWRKFQ